MKSVWDNIKIKLSNALNSKDDKEYLANLVERLECLKAENKCVPFTINSVKEKGFVVKVWGLFAYVSFFHMPWKYNSVEFWKPVSKHLIGKKFYCNIYSIQKEPLSILVNAECHHFRQINLVENSEYLGIVMNKAKYGIFIDIGYHFNWEYGSFVGLMHISNFSVNEYEQIGVGDIVNTIFYGYTEDRKIILGNSTIQKEWLTGELENLVGTIQEVKMKITENGKRAFYVKEKFKTTIPIRKIYYPGCKSKAKKLIYSLNDNDVIQCEILKINKRRKVFVSKLLLDKDLCDINL
ncbi:MAG: small subunit ribosomal protein [Tenuifilum sp.]|jgi:hypothetical protein|nr:small subunit ribosomal protein [Tenuifilum sp.]